jgi:hypothetical protein
MTMSVRYLDFFHVRVFPRVVLFFVLFSKARCFFDKGSFLKHHLKTKIVPNVHVNSRPGNCKCRRSYFMCIIMLSLKLV